MKPVEQWTTGHQPASPAQMDQIHRLAARNRFDLPFLSSTPAPDGVVYKVTKRHAFEMIQMLRAGRKPSDTYMQSLIVEGGEQQPDVIPDPDTWQGANDPATTAQLKFLRNLKYETNDSIKITKEMTKAEACKHIDRMKEKRNRARANRRALAQCVTASMFACCGCGDNSW